MDNITHSLFGAAVAETTWAHMPEKMKARLAPGTRTALVLASILGNNLPDLDFIYARWMHVNPQLGNLLHHRGHTHTMTIAFFQSLLLLGLCVLWRKLRRKTDFKEEWRWVSLMAFLGPLTHMLLDWLNNYGVHPFWPIDNSWKYGDWIFVLEPWAWVTFSTCLFFQARTLKGRILAGAIPLLGLFLSWGLGVVPTLMSSVLTGWGLVLAVTYWKLSERARWNTAWTAIALMLFIFHWGSHRTEAILKKLNTTAEYSTDDTILSPLPVNPLCWAVITVDSNATHYRLKRAVVAPFPHLVSLATCTHLRFFSAEVAEAPLDTVIVWEKEHVIVLSELGSLVERFCDVRDFLQFARAPYFWMEGDQLYFSDLRFERSKGRSFARVAISSQSPPCPSSRAPWEPPLKALRRIPKASFE